MANKAAPRQPRRRGMAAIIIFLISLHGVSTPFATVRARASERALHGDGSGAVATSPQIHWEKLRITPETRPVPSVAGSLGVQVRYRLELDGADRRTSWSYFPGDTLETDTWTAQPGDWCRAVDGLVDPSVSSLPYSPAMREQGSSDQQVALALIRTSPQMRSYLQGRSVLGQALTWEQLTLVDVRRLGIVVSGVSGGMVTRGGTSDSDSVSSQLCIDKFACLYSQALLVANERNAALQASSSTPAAPDTPAAAATGNSQPIDDDGDVVFLIPERLMWLDGTGWALTGICFVFSFTDSALLDCP